MTKAGGSREGGFGTLGSMSVGVGADGGSPEGYSPPKERHHVEASKQAVDLGALFDEHASFLVRVVARMVGTNDRAEDVVQRAFLIAHRKGLPPGDADKARAWMYRVCMNEVRHERRSVARRLRLASRVSQEPTPTTASEPDAALESATQVRQVRSVVDKLPSAQKEVFVLYELEEMTGTQISKLLDVPENTVWSRLRLARARFRKLWAEQAGDQP